MPQNLADLRAQLAANARGARELQRAAAEHGRATLLAYMRHVQDNAEHCMRRAIRQLHDGRFRYELDDGQAIEVRIAVDRAAGSADRRFHGHLARSATTTSTRRAP